VFSRLKGQRSLNNIKVRGRMKVAAHCYLSLIALQATTNVGPEVAETRQLHLPIVKAKGQVGETHLNK